MSKKIMIVDDDPTNVEKLYNFLQTRNFDTAIANNGERAYKVALNFMPDLILMDVLMPGWDGFETTKVFKSDPQLQNIPIIFVTAKLEEAEKAFEYGAADYIIKPFSDIELQARIEFQLRANLRFQVTLQSNTSLNLKLSIKERELAAAQKKIASLQLQLKENSANITTTDTSVNKTAPDPRSFSDQEFEKQINKP